MTFGNKLVKLFGVKISFLQSTRAKVLTTSVLFDCLLGKHFQKHNEGKIIYLVQKLNAGC